MSTTDTTDTTGNPGSNPAANPAASSGHLPQVPLGDTLRVSALGFGGMALSHVYGGTSTEAALKTLNAAVDLGVTFLDTADVYGEPRPGTQGPAGTNEELFAQILRHRREEIQLATKFGITGLTARAGEVTPPPSVRGDAEYVRSSVEASLRRLQVDHIDLYYVHRRDFSVPLAVTIGALAELVAQGKIRTLGLSEVTAAELREAHAIHPIAAVQSEWSIWSRDIEAQVVPAAAELGVGIVPYSPLGRGFLTGTQTRESVAGTFLAGEARWGENFDANQAIVAEIAAVAAEIGATSAQVALAWLYRRGQELGAVTVPIPGTRSAARVAENAGSYGLAPRLTDAQLERLGRLSEATRGTRDLSFSPADWLSLGRE